MGAGVGGLCQTKKGKTACSAGDLTTGHSVLTVLGDKIEKYGGDQNKIVINKCQVTAATFAINGTAVSQLRHDNAKSRYLLFSLEKRDRRNF